MRPRVNLLAILLTTLPFALLRGAQDGADASVLFTKEFPNSDPAYISIVVKADGNAVYRFAEEERPVSVQLSAETAQKVFQLTDQLNRFQDINLESKRRVAQMGRKTFAYENGSERFGVSFNHTDQPEAVQLTELFERLSQTFQHLDRLRYLLQFDRLGVVKELLRIESNLNRGQLAEAGLLLPTLEAIRKDSSLVNVAQSRAAVIIEKLQNLKTGTP